MYEPLSPDESSAGAQLTNVCRDELARIDGGATLFDQVVSTAKAVYDLLRTVGSGPVV